MTSNKNPTAIIVYLGRIMGKGKTEHSRVAVITDEERTQDDPASLTRIMHYSVKSFRYARPGQTFRMKVTRDSQDAVDAVYPESAEFLGLFGTTEWRAGHDAELKAHNTQQQERKRDAKLKAADPLDEIMQPLIDIYANANPPTRPQLLARIVYKLTTGNANYR